MNVHDDVLTNSGKERVRTRVQVSLLRSYLRFLHDGVQEIEPDRQSRHEIGVKLNELVERWLDLLQSVQLLGGRLVDVRNRGLRR